LEKAAAKEVGLTYVSYSMANRGKDALSLQYMPDDKVFTLIETIGNDIVKRSETGGVAFHCKSGKDRTGLVAGYLRVKYQHWSVDQAIAEMRQNGHVWKSFLKPGNSFSWHEEHLRSIAEKLAAEPKATGL
jgi:protein-tyrosine phosphatase